MSNQQWGPPQGQQWNGYPPPAGPPAGGYQPPPQYAAPNQYYGQPALGWGHVPPPKKKRSAAPVVLGILGLAVLGVVGFVVISMLGNSDEPTVTRPIVTTQPTSEPTDGGPFPTTPAPPSLPPTTRPPSVPVTTRPTPTSKPTPTAAQLVIANPLYRTGVQRAVACTESRVGLSSVSKANSYYQQIKKCLDRAWPRQVQAAGYQFRTPGLVSWVGAANSPCGNSDRSLSFYCSTNHTIYMDVSDDVGYWKQSQSFTRALATHTVAHEYAHAMQQLTRILPAYYNVRYQSSPAKALELNRRMELQASCLGNVFLGANRGPYGIKGSLYTQWLYIVKNSGDISTLPRDHGSRKNHGYWAQRGFNARSTAVCNTFVAPGAQVS